MARDEDRIVCQTPTPGKRSTRIPRWKYDLVRRAILDVVPVDGDGYAFKNLPDAVSHRLSDTERAGLGSVSWYTTVVKLDLEVKGELRRLAGSRPQRLVRS